jgi:tRNA-modifying protein YgfZ
MSLSQWQSYLITQGAHLDNGAIMHFGHPEQERKHLSDGNIICDLSHLTLLELNGADAANFLQGQVTNDVKLLNGQQAHYTGYCSPKGRLLGLFLAFAHQGHLHLQMPSSIAEGIAKRLRMYVLRSKVVITDKSDSIIKLGLNGPHAEEILTALFGDTPIEPYALKTLEQATIVRLPSIAGQQRYEIFTSTEHADSIWKSLNLKASPVGKPCWDWLEIQSGIAEIIVATQEQFVPQMVNLDVLNAINFKKGCYTGQEIVARTHYLGSVKRRTFLMEVSSDVSPQAGDKLLDEYNNEIGQVVRVAPNLVSGFDLLSELRIEAQQAGPIFWLTHMLTNKALPYSLGLTGS